MLTYQSLNPFSLLLIQLIINTRYIDVQLISVLDYY